MTKEQKTTLCIFSFAVVLVVWKIWVLYYGFRTFGYMVPPGEDPIYHYAMIEGILAGHWNAIYPPLFHALVALVSQVFHTSSLMILKNLTPLMVLLPPVAVYIFLSKNFSRLAGMIGFTVAILASNYGLVAYGDGNYPNILAAGFFMPIALSYIVSAFRQKPKKNVLTALVFILLMILTHHLTTALFLAVLIFYLLVLVLWNKYELIVPRLNKALIALGACLALGIIVIALTPLRGMFVEAFENLRQGGSVLQTNQFLQIPTLTECSQMLGEFPFYLGLGALIYLAVMLSRPKDQSNKPAIILILVWFFVIFALSQTSFVSLPARIAREMGIPLLLAIAVFASDVIQSLKHKKSKVIVIGLLALFVSSSLVQINAGAYQAPDFFSKMVWFWPADKEKTDFIVNAPDPAQKVLANPSSPYLSYFGQGKIVILNDVPDSDEVISRKINLLHIDQILIINASKQNPFADYVKRDDMIKEKLKAYATENELEVYRTFSDGSIIYTTTPIEPMLTSSKNRLK